MLKAKITPSVEALTEELMPCLWEGIEESEVRSIVREIKHLGYEISRPLEIYGKMEEALRNLEDHPEGYEIVQRK